MAARESAYPPCGAGESFGEKPMGVRIEGRGFTTYVAARTAGSRALADFLEQLELESLRID